MELSPDTSLFPAGNAQLVHLTAAQNFLLINGTELPTITYD